MQWVLTGGHDHALAATFPATAALPEGYVVVGEVVAGEGVRVDGEPVEGSVGHAHF
jgi:thiamine-monophosphate kinase